MKRLLVFAAGIALASSVYAQDEIFRTLAAGTGIYQSTNPVTAKPAYGTQEFFGHSLVSAVLGMPQATVLSNEVLALQVDCGSTTASLVAWDTTSSTVLQTIAVCTNLSVVLQQDVATNQFPNREHFVGQFTVATTSNLLGGTLMIAGRLQLSPTNYECPRAIRFQVDKLDPLFKDTDGTSPDDLKNRDILRAGVAHAVGTVNLVFDDHSTNQVLFPFIAMSIRHQLN